MPKRYFSKLTEEDREYFNKDVKILTGMLYSIAKFPLKENTPILPKLPIGFE
jgi:hypothetical protein